MSFYGRTFIYDDVPSENYGLFISDIDASAVNRTMGNTSVEIYEKKLFRRATPYFYGATPSKKLSFKFSSFSEDELTGDDFELVQKWLFGSKTYKKFQVVQEDMQQVYFNAIMNDPEIVRVGNMIMGFTCNVECDSPFAYLFPKTTTYSYTGSTVDSVEEFYNASDDADSYLYPKLVITVNSFGGDVTIRNLSESSRSSVFTSLSPNEVITIDSSFQTISSSTGLKRLSNFNKKFLRLVPGLNRLRVQGNVASVVMTTQFISKKIGG